MTDGDKIMADGEPHSAALLSRRMVGLDPYKPGEQPNDRQYIKLNANENPYPPCPDVVKETTSFLTSRPRAAALYADPDSTTLRKEIAAMLCRTGGVFSRAQAADGEGKARLNGGGIVLSPSARDKLPFTVTPDMVYCGNGSDEVLSLSFYAFFDDVLVTPEYSYSFYPVYCGYYGVRQEKVPLMSDWKVDAVLMAKTAARLHASTIIANPNAPTGVSLTREEVRWMLDNSPRDKVFMVDEAYVDFGGESVLALLQDYPNLCIVRTFSKSMCAAGMRLGYLVANKALVDAITTVKNSMNHFPVDAIAQVFGSSSCRHDAYYAARAMDVVRERERFAAFLNGHGWCTLPSSANFVFTKKDGVAGKDAYLKIKEHGILVRRFDTPGIEDYLRITIGTRDEMTALMDVMARIY